MAPTPSRLTFALLASTALGGVSPLAAQNLPQGPSVAAGSVSISTPSANAMAIQQSSGLAIVNWQAFSIGQGAAVNVSQPSAQSAMLSRVTGPTGSVIAGQLAANGQFYLVNPNGIAITKTGVVNASGFVASTLNISDRDFLAGNRTFTGNGNSAPVVNEGAITVGPGGYAALLGGRVENSGTITVPAGRVGLGAGEQVTLDLSGDGFLQVAVPSSGDGSGKALIENSGRIRANGGLVEMKAASLREAARNVINVSGVVEARTVSGRNGAIVLGGGDGGTVRVSGRLDASGGRRAVAQGRPSSAKGGAITVTGDKIELAGARIDASGAAGGGQVRIGGEYQGGPGLQRAATTSIDGATTIRADALRAGDGGRVIVWSDQVTTFAGLISAKGGPEGGNGGFAEVSGKALLAYSGLTDLSAAKGAFGTLLLDPFNVTISSDPDSGTTSGPGQSGTPIGNVSGTQFSPNQNDSVINVTTLTNALATANVLVNTGTGGTQPGNITVAAPISWSQPTSLALNAAGGIFINAPITSSGGGSLGLQSVTGVTATAALTFTGLPAGGTAQSGVGIQTNGPVTLASVSAPFGGLILTAGTGQTATATGAVQVGVFGMNRGNWVQNSGSLPAFSATSFTITPPATFQRVQGGNGSSASPFGIVDIYGLQGIGTSTTFLGQNYVQLVNISAAGTSNWNNGAGFVPIGATFPFSGSYNGGGFTIDRLTIATNISTVGLFGTVQGSVSNLTLANSLIRSGYTGTGTSSVGALAGQIGTSGRVSGVTIQGGSVAGSPSTNPGFAYTGGLAGQNLGTITNSSSSATVAGGGASAYPSTGGLVGQNAGSITLSFATGDVTGGTGSSFDDVGGLVGYNTGTLNQVYATGNVTGGRATGAGGIADAGGLVGDNSGPVSQAFATGNVTGGTATGSGGSSSTGGLVGLQSSTVDQSFAIGRVTPGSAPNGTVQSGGIVGDGSTSGVTSSFFDTQTTGQSGGAGTGQTSAQLQSGLPAGFSPAVFGTGINGQTSYPFLLNLPIPASILNSTGRGAATPTPAPAPEPAPIPTTPPAQLAGNNNVSPTLSRQLAQAVVPVPRSETVIEVNLGGGGGPSLGVGSAGLGGAASPAANTRSGAQQALAGVQRSAQDLERELARCQSSGQGYGACVGGALDRFANALDTRILTLPAPLRNVAAVIRQAAISVRSAPTVAAARAIVQSAVAQVRSAIALIRADDPAVARLQVRQGNVIASALQSVDRTLARATGL